MWICDSFCLDLGGKAVAVFAFDGFVDFALLAAHFAVDDAFGFGGQLGGDLFFGAAQDKGVGDFGEQRGGGLVLLFVYGVGKVFFEMAAAAEQAGVDKVKLGV